MAWVVGLGVGGGGADISEDPDLIGGGDDGLDGGGAKWWVRCRFPRVCGELWEDLPNDLPFFFDFCRNMFLVSLERRIGECGWGAYWRKCWSVGEIGAWHILKWGVSVRFGNGVEIRWGKGAWGDAHRVGYSRSLRIVCCYLRFSQNRMLCENGIWSILEDWPLESAKCVLWRRLKCRNENAGCRFSLECDRCISVCGAWTRVALLSEHCVN